MLMGVEFGSLNVIGPHKLIGTGSIRRCDFIQVGMALLEEVCHCGGGLKCRNRLDQQGRRDSGTLLQVVYSGTLKQFSSPRGKPAHSLYGLGIANPSTPLGDSR